MAILSIAVIVCLTLFLLSLIHLYWGFGGTWASNVAVPTDENNRKIFTPKLFECLVVAIGLFMCTLFILMTVEIISFTLPGWLMKYGLWVLAFVFLLRSIGEFRYVGFFKKINSTPFARSDTKYYSPLCLTLGLLIVVLALNVSA
jgi:hypothetical protein